MVRRDSGIWSPGRFSRAAGLPHLTGTIVPHGADHTADSMHVSVFSQSKADGGSGRSWSPDRRAAAPTRGEDGWAGPPQCAPPVDTLAPRAAWCRENHVSSRGELRKYKGRIQASSE